uniref:Fibronectin type-II domain-containing protein n=1 Tax=Lepeophtheirus salmonis TaxID=72036 RepID=A0A0K2VFD5_LEPSM
MNHYSSVVFKDRLNTTTLGIWWAVNIFYCFLGCRTTDGFKCIFPFKYYGKTYNNCTNVDNGSIDWCATSLDINENVMGWGHIFRYK